MRYGRAEKLEIIRLVEQSELPAKRTLAELQVSRASFYRWYRAYREAGVAGVGEAKASSRQQFWNRVPDHEREQVVEVALAKPELSPRELAWHITDSEGWFISESSVYRILKAFDLVTSPNYIVLSAADKFSQPTRRVHELWQTDFTYMKIQGWGWYYLGTVLDDFSRYVICWRLFTGMSSDDVKVLLDEAVALTGMAGVPVRHRPRLLSDNGPMLRLEGPGRVDGRERDEARPRQAISSADPRQDRALPPDNEERGEVAELLAAGRPCAYFRYDSPHSANTD
jgi:putative transposase